MSLKIVDLVTHDIRFPTSKTLDGSDAMNPDPDYSAAYVILKTDSPDGLAGHGMTFTIGRGNELCVAATAGDTKRAMEIQFQLMPVHKHLFVEANPIPVKWAMAQLGLIQPDLRLPLTGLAPQHHDTVRAALREAGLAH